MFDKVVEILSGLEGLEFGGPTELFWNLNCGMPLYQNVKLDGGNLFENNFFQNSFSETFNYKHGTGIQYNVDCADPESLKKIDKKYDFIVTSHVIEHIANPIKAIISWKELLNKGGYILSVIPNYKHCFDRNRPLTSFLHLIEDFLKNTPESDTTHIEEQKQLHDWSCGGHPDFYKLCEDNKNTRVVHHHTFDLESSRLLMCACILNPILHFQHDELNIVSLSQIL